MAGSFPIVTPSFSHCIGTPGPSSRLALDVGPPVSSFSSGPWHFGDPHHPEGILSVRVVMLEKVPKDLPYFFPHQSMKPTEAVFALPNPRTDPKHYSQALGALVDHLRDHIASTRDCAVILRAGQQCDLDTAIRLQNDRSTSRDSDQPYPQLITSLSGLVEVRKAILPLALVLLCAIPQLVSETSQAAVSKVEIADRLYGLVALWPDGNPPRAALKRVNEYLMSEGRG